MKKSAMTHPPGEGSHLGSEARHAPACSEAELLRKDLQLAADALRSEDSILGLARGRRNFRALVSRYFLLKLQRPARGRC